MHAQIAAQTTEHKDSRKEKIQVIAPSPKPIFGNICICAESNFK